MDIKNKGGRPKTHGMSQGNRFYKIYFGIHDRCYNPQASGYYRYGGRGITCERVRFEDFYNDMYESYVEHCSKYGERNTSIDRIDGDGNYSRENCKRATQKEQMCHTSLTKKIEYDGKKFTSLKSLSEYVGVGYELLKSRLLRGWNLGEAINTNKGTKKHKPHELGNKYL